MGYRKRQKKYGNKKTNNVLVKTAYNMAKQYVHRQIENKHIIGHVSSWTAIPSTAIAPTFGEITLITQGDDSPNRTGDRVRGRYLEMNWIFKHTGANLCALRLIVFYWNDATAPTVSTLLSNAETQSVLQLTRACSRGLVLADYLLPTDATNYSTRTLRIRKKINNIRTFYTGAANNTGIKGRLYYMIGMTDASDASYQMSFRYVFEDS